MLPKKQSALPFLGPKVLRKELELEAPPTRFLPDLLPELLHTLFSAPKN